MEQRRSKSKEKCGSGGCAKWREPAPAPSPAAAPPSPGSNNSSTLLNRRSSSLMQQHSIKNKRSSRGSLNTRVGNRPAHRRYPKIPALRGDLKADMQSEEEQRKSNQEETRNIDARIIGNRQILTRGYRIINLIGSGSYAHVFRAADTGHQNRDVALKLIEMEKCSRNYRKNFLRNEVHIIRKLDALANPNIIVMYEAFNIEQPAAYVMVMEYIDNGTWSDRILARGAMPEDQARPIFRGVLNGLLHMHDSGVAHRDLKPENILLTVQDVAKICDFSLSTFWDRRQSALCTEWCGTPPFFAPEIFQKVPYDPFAYDVYSLGVTLFVVCNMMFPFYHDNYHVVLQRQLNNEYKFRYATLSAEYRSLIGQMLEPDFRKRITCRQIAESEWLRGKSLPSIGGGAGQPQRISSVRVASWEKWNESRQ